MNAIDQWEQEEAALQLAALRKEDAAFAALPAEERARIIKEGLDRLEACADEPDDDGGDDD
jgi:hypothetical protein